MNIAVVCHPTYGGSGVIAAELGLQMAKRGHNIHFISYEKPVRITSFTENVFFHEVDIPAYPVFKHPPVTLSISAKIAEVCKNENIDVVHAHYALPYSISAYFAKKMINGDFTLVTTLHGTDISVVGQDKTFLETVKFCINNSDVVTCVSEYLKKLTIQEFSVQREIHVIPNFINHDIFSPDRKKGMGFFSEKNGKTLMHLSNFRHYKNVETVVKVFAKIRKKIHCQLALIGEGPALSDVRKIARELSVCDDILFLGNQTYVESILPYADLFVFPSKEESFGVALLEAMSCGVSFIASNAGGIPELAGKELKSLLFSPGNVNAMVKKGLELLTNHETRNTTSKKCRERVVNAFNMHKITDQYLDIYGAE